MFVESTLAKSRNGGLRFGESSSQGRTSGRRLQRVWCDSRFSSLLELKRRFLSAERESASTVGTAQFPATKITAVTHAKNAL